MPKFMATQHLTRSQSSTGSLPAETQKEQTREGSKGKFALCQNPECSSQQTGELRRVAAHGLCFSCYRKYRESRNPNLLVKRRAHGASYARRIAMSKKLERQLELLDSIEQGVLGTFKGALPEPLYSQLQNALHSELTKVTQEWSEERDRRLKSILRMEQIEERGKVPIIVASDEVVRKDMLPQEVLDAYGLNDGYLGEQDDMGPDGEESEDDEDAEDEK